MVRLLTWGFETNFIDTGSTSHPDGIVNGTVPPTVSSSVFRSGAYSAKCDSTTNLASNVGRVGAGNPVTASATNYSRMYFRFDQLPTVDTRIVRAGNTAIWVKLTTAGKLQLWNAITNLQVGSDSVATVAADASTWYRIELAVTLNATPQVTGAELRLDGVSVASVTGLALTITTTQEWQYGWGTPPGANRVCYCDDGAINDSTGATQNSWPGEGKVVLLVPTADSAAGSGWTLGTGTAPGGNGFAAMDNRPPLGVADLAAGSDPKQIRNAAAAANANYDVTMQSYTAAGVPSGATINVIDPFVETAAPVSTGAKLGTIGVVSNPAIANVNLGATGTAAAFWQGTAAAAYPVGWKWSHGTITPAPSVTLGTAPVMRITQVTSSTRIAMVCLMGMYVDYTPAAVAAPDVKARMRVEPSVAVMRAAVR